MFHADIELRRQIWECVSYIVFFANNPDENMHRYYVGKLAGIRSMLQYVDHKTLSTPSFFELSDLLASTLIDNMST